MRNLNGVEISVVSGGAELRYCDVEDSKDINKIYGRFSFVSDPKVASDDVKKEIYEAIKSTMLKGASNTTLVRNKYNFVCYIQSQ